jgi:hypothetical protein
MSYFVFWCFLGTCLENLESFDVQGIHCGIAFSCLYQQSPQTESSAWWFQRCFIVHILGIILQKTDELIFFRGVGQPPTSHNSSRLQSQRCSALWFSCHPPLKIAYIRQAEHRGSSNRLWQPVGAGVDGSGAKVVVGFIEMVGFVCSLAAPPWWSFLTPLYEYLKLCVYVYIYNI